MTIFWPSDATDWSIQQWLAFVLINCFCSCNSLLLVFITCIIIVIITVVSYLSISMLFVESSLHQTMCNSSSFSTFYCPYSSLEFLILLFIDFFANWLVKHVQYYASKCKVVIVHMSQFYYYHLKLEYPLCFSRYKTMSYILL